MVEIQNTFVRILCNSYDYDCSAARPYRCAWRARKRRPHTHAISVRSTTQARRPRRRWSTSKLTDASMKFQLQTVNYVHFFIKAASIKFWTVKGSKGGTYVRIYILTFTCMWKFRLIFKIGRKLRVTEGTFVRFEGTIFY